MRIVNVLILKIVIEIKNNKFNKSKINKPKKLTKNNKKINKNKIQKLMLRKK